MTDRGELVIGAKRLARVIFQDEKRWRSLHRPAMRSALGLFMLGGRLAGYTKIIEARITAKVPLEATESAA
jgi:hypothetical protein